MIEITQISFVNNKRKNIEMLKLRDKIPLLIGSKEQIPDI